MATQTSDRPVVIVEDDDEIRECLRDALEMEGYGVNTYINGQEALLALQAKLVPSLILLDLMMPVMDGWRFMEAKNLLPDPFSKIPVVVVSAVADQNRLSGTGASGHIRKPIDLDVLLEVVGKYCETTKG